MQSYQKIYLLLVLISVIKLQVNAQEASPCPRLFTYEPKGLYRDRWYGLITLLHDTDLHGIWIQIIFDKPILQLGNWFGQATKKGPTYYLIKNPDFYLKAYTPHVVRLFVRYHEEEEPPKLMEFRLNARPVCPEQVTTTPSTTTEQLFTSAPEDEEGASYVSGETKTTQAALVATTTQQPFVAGMNYGVEQSLHVTNASVEDICGTTALERRRTRHIGQIAHKGEFPWHAMLYHAKDITIAYLCGASLISRLHLLTVAHCVVKNQSPVPINPETLIVYLGKDYVKNWSHDGSQVRYVADITPHPDYNPETYNNDIAVVKLLTPADFNELVRPVCLWKDLSDPGSRPGTVIGWGFDETTKLDERLMSVQMVKQEQDVCNRTISKYLDRFSSGHTYCANFIDDTVECVGDSGGSMVYPTVPVNNTDSVWQLKGLITVSVVLQHDLKCDRNHSVVFTDVTKYHEWVQECTNL